jgi:hypothetical protein
MFGEAAFTGFHIPAWIVRTKRRGMGALKKRNHPHGFELSRFVRTAKYWRRQGIEVLLLNFALKFNKCTSVGLSTSALLLPI